jgi:hypothetical protein
VELQISDAEQIARGLTETLKAETDRVAQLRASAAVLKAQMVNQLDAGDRDGRDLSLASTALAVERHQAAQSELEASSDLGRVATGLSASLKGYQQSMASSQTQLQEALQRPLVQAASLQTTLETAGSHIASLDQAAQGVPIAKTSQAMARLETDADACSAEVERVTQHLHDLDDLVVARARNERALADSRTKGSRELSSSPNPRGSSGPD